MKGVGMKVDFHQEYGSQQLAKSVGPGDNLNTKGSLLEVDAHVQTAGRIAAPHKPQKDA